MKTYYFSSKTASSFSLIGLLTLFLTSCASYQNASYYDTDGVYQDSRPNEGRTVVANTGSYQPGYFHSLQNDPEFFTDVDGYSSYQNDSVYVAEQGYPAWGSTSDNVTVNFYDNSWGWNNWGWNGWYGGGWGLGFNNWYGGWGWNNWGWNNWGWGLGWNNFYGPGWGWGGYWGGWNNWYGGNYYNNFNRHSTYSYGRRGYTNPAARSATYSRNGAVRYRSDSYNNARRSDTYNTRNIGTRFDRTNTGTRNSNYNTARPVNGTRTQGTRPANYNTTRNNNNYNTPTRNSGTRNQSVTPSRSYSSPPASSGGSRGGGGSTGGGGRSGGGGRRG